MRAAQTCVAPSHICVYYDIATCKATVAFLKTILEMGHQGQLVLDLRRTLYMSGGAALMLFAHVNYLQLLYGSRDRVRCIFPSQTENPAGHSWIVRTQLSRALMSGSLDGLKQLVKDKVFFQSSNDPNTHAAVTVTQLTEKLSLSPQHQLSLMLGSAITEAMLNVSYHAYEHAPDAFSGALSGRWWQYAHFDEEDGAFVFLIYDLGLGVLKSYKNAIDPSGIKPDAYLLEEALSYGFSRSKDASRGVGSEDMKHPITQGKEQLLICCSDYRYIYEGEDKPAQIERKPFVIHGNLVEWSLETEVNKEDI